MDNQADIQAVLDKRHDNGGNFWARYDSRLAVGSPFSTIESLLILHELGLPANHEAVHGALVLLLGAWREDGRYKFTPRGTIYPCHTANAARILCRFGCTADERVQTSLAHLLDNIHHDGGWRCNRAPMGRSRETDLANPGVTLFVLDAFRFTDQLNNNPALDRAADTLLDHWTVRRPLGPCTFGIGTLFMQVEYPFLRYNLFYYVYILSFYDHAKDDPRLQEAFQALQEKLDEDGQMVIERPNRKLAGISAFAKDQASQPANRRYQEILANLDM